MLENSYEAKLSQPITAFDVSTKAKNFLQLLFISQHVITV